jgi:cytochrome c oxidase subunit IV
MDDSHAAVHVTPVRVYLVVFALLIALTAITVTVAQINLGAMNVVAALVIAALKAMLVAAFFMHLRFSSSLTRFIVVVAVLFVGILIFGSLDDELTRTTRTYRPYASLDGVVPGIGLDGIPAQRER